MVIRSNRIDNPAREPGSRNPPLLNCWHRAERDTSVLGTDEPGSNPGLRRKAKRLGPSRSPWQLYPATKKHPGIEDETFTDANGECWSRKRQSAYKCLAGFIQDKKGTMSTAFEDRYTPEPNTGCWLWTMSGYSSGYGKMQYNRSGKVTTECAHRYSWRVHNGEIPAGLLVLHKCDTPPCVNPRHLFLGSQAANMADMVQKGRGRWRVARAAPTHKVCPRCKENKPIADLDSQHRYCKPCHRANSSEWKSRNIEKYLQSQRDYNIRRASA